MNPFALASLLVSGCCFILAILIFLYAKNSTHRIWAQFNIVVSLWAGGLYLAGISKLPGDAIICWRFAYWAGHYVTILFYHFVYRFCNLKKRSFLFLVYLQGLIFPIVIFSRKFINSTVYVFDSFYYHQGTLLYGVFIFLVISIVLLCFIELLNFAKVTQGLKRTQTLYFLWGFALGWVGGITTFLPPYGMRFYPIWHITICVYTLLMTYAIFKYQLMDVKVVLTRTSIFVAVYSFVLGLPITIIFVWQQKLTQLFGVNWWVLPFSVCYLLATIGPFLYLYIQKIAENKLLEDQRQYQSTLRQAAQGMGRIKDLGRLVNLIAEIITKSVRLQFCSIFVYSTDKKNFLKYSIVGEIKENDGINWLDSNSEIVRYFIDGKHNFLIFEEVYQRFQNVNDNAMIQLRRELSDLKAAIIIPCFIESKLLAVFILGNKLSKDSFSEEDISVFSILANQAALAIENAQFYEDIKRTHDQLVKAEKMATIGTMADGLSHQINNRLHALGFIAGDALDTIKLKRDLAATPELKEFFVDMEHAFSRIQDNVTRGGEIVEGLLKYTRKGAEGFSEFSLDELIESSLDMAQFKIKPGEMEIVREYFDNIPSLWGNFTQFQEVFFNLIDNAYDATMQKKSESTDPGYRPVLKVNAEKDNNGNINIYVEDNGIGVKSDDKDKLFTPFFTTKLSSKKGTGLGLYVIQKLIEENHNGKVVISSEYGKGTRFQIVLPLRKQMNQNEERK